MKKIGIVGKSGAGKTTFSRMLKKNDRIAIINIDDVKKDFNLVSKEYENNIGEKIVVPKSKLLIDLLDVLRRNRIFDKIFIKVLGFFEEKNVKKLIEQYERENYESVIIERRKIRKSFYI